MVKVTLIVVTAESAHAILESCSVENHTALVVAVLVDVIMVLDQVVVVWKTEKLLNMENQ